MQREFYAPGIPDAMDCCGSAMVHRNSAAECSFASSMDSYLYRENRAMEPMWLLLEFAATAPLDAKDSSVMHSAAAAAEFAVPRILLAKD